MSGRIRIGISGWVYTPWRGVFYPSDWPQKRELEYSSRALGGSLEINGTFYRMQTPSSFRAWFEQTPDDFQFAVKGPRYITHMKRLREVEAPLGNFIASGLLHLGHKLGPILWQFPPNFKFNEDLLEAFIEQLPRDTVEATSVGAKHDKRVKRPYLETDAKRKMRHAIEVRHPSFACDEFIRLLRRHNIALVVAESAGKWMLAEDVTADFVYLRLHGAEQLYISGYTDKQLAHWATRIRAWNRGKEPRGARTISDRPAKSRAPGRDVYVFFDNTDIKLRAPFDALALMQRLKIKGDSTLPPPPKLDKIREE